MNYSLDLDINNYTPVMQQYLKSRQSLDEGSVLLFRMGDFYEAFFDDAALIAKELEITLTSRAETRHPGGRLPMAGVPAKTIQPYTAKLLERGYKVAIAEQMADPKTCKGLVPREIVKIYTPGTIDELDLLNSFANNFICAICPQYKSGQQIKYGADESISYGLAYTDVSTGEFYLTEIEGKYLEQEIARINPAEIIVPSIKDKIRPGEIRARDTAIVKLKSKHYCSNLEIKHFNAESAKEKIKKVFQIQSLESFSASEFQLGVQAAGAIISYLEETQLQNSSEENPFSNFDKINSYQVSNYMMLDASTRKNLELSKTLNGNTKGSLFSAIDRSASKPGKRKLKSWLEQPLYQISEIMERQNAVSALHSAPESCERLSELLEKIYDLERLSIRLASEKINARELVALKKSLELVPEISLEIQKLLDSTELRSEYITKLSQVAEEVFDSISAIDTAVVDEPPIQITDGHLIKHGYNQELDEYISLVEDSESWLNSFENQERERSGIKNLKINFNKVHGYFIEITKSNLNQVPENYHCKQTMVNNSRFITEELKDFEDKITNAQSRRNALEYKLFTELRASLRSKSSALKKTATEIAELDALLSMARIALEQNFNKPELENSFALDIKAARHPVIEQSLAMGEFVANDLELSDKEKIMVLTGPNMAGKSTFMRQNAIVILLAQIGSYVPADYARIGLVDRIFTRIGASDDLSSGQSTFMVEMNETAAILNGMSEKSFIILDEIGRGTSTYDGVAIAWSVLEYIARSSQARTIFATHYHELAELEQNYEIIHNHQMLISEENGQIEFLHKVAPGSADRSYGIEVARLAGLPSYVLSRAKSINSQLQSNKTNKLKKPKQSEAVDIESLPLFS